MDERDPRLLVGAVFFAAFAILFFAGAYVMWPPAFLAGLSAGPTTTLVLRALATPVLAAIGLEFSLALAVVLLSDH